MVGRARDGEPFGGGALNDALLRDALAAGSLAALVSGAPSTLHALATGADPLEASLAAGQMLLRNERRPLPLLAVAAPVHVSISLGWAVALAATLPRRRTAAWGALAGLGIAALDLGVIGRRFPRIAALPTLPQVADHVAYGVAVGAVLSVRRVRARRDAPPG